MKIFWMGLMVLALAAPVRAEENVQVKVTGDRVSLRAAPELNSVLLDRAMSGDLLTLKDDSNAEWIGVMPPDRVDAWVHGEFIEDGTVIPSRLNVRSGPSLNHSVLGIVYKGESVTVRGEAAGWLRIAPPDDCIVWISRRYAEIIGAEKSPSIVIKVEPDPDLKEAEEAETVPQQDLDAVISPSSGDADLPDALAPDPEKPQGQDIAHRGILRPAGGALYKLIEVDTDDDIVCYVCGNAKQMSDLDGQKLRIMGRAYWALDIDQPVIIPVRIQPLD